jgi:invasion protein IalB
VQIIIRIAALALGLVGLATAGHAEKVSKAFGQWYVICADAKSGGRNCGLVSSMVNNKKVVIFRWAVTPNKDGGNKATITTLTGVRVSDGISVQFGKSEPVRIPYQVCTAKACVAEIPFSDTWLKTFKASKGFSVNITLANGTQRKYDLDLNKFSAAFDFYTAETAKTQ